MNQYRRLQDLQELEKEETKLKDELNSLPQINKLRQLKKEIEEEQNYLKKEKEKFDLQRKKLKNLENAVSKEREELELLSTKLFSGEISNLKELEGTDTKRKSLEEQIKELEELSLTEMEVIEQNKNRLNELNGKLKVKKETFKVILEDYNELQKGIKAHLEKIPQERTRLESQIDKQIMTDYNDKKSNYANNYVVEIKNQTCQGCHMTVPFQIMKIIKSDHFAKCDKCGRILI